MDQLRYAVTERDRKETILKLLQLGAKHCEMDWEDLWKNQIFRPTCRATGLYEEMHRRTAPNPLSHRELVS